MKIEELDQPEERKEKFKEFSRKPHGFLLLAGKNGTGKTTIAKAIYQQSRLIEPPKYNAKVWFTSTDLYHKYLQDFKRFGDVSYSVEQYSGASLLVLDDLGSRKEPPPGFHDFLFSIIEKRERSKEYLGTIITTNLNSAEMREKFGDAIVSRVASGIVFKFEGRDRRFKEF